MGDDDDWDAPPARAGEDETGGAAALRRFKQQMSSNVSKDDFKPAECRACGQQVDRALQLTIDGQVFHKTCLRCKVCDKVLSAGTYAALEGKYYCKPHFSQLFKTKGNYSESFGEEDPKKRWQRPAAGEQAE